MKNLASSYSSDLPRSDVQLGQLLLHAGKLSEKDIEAIAEKQREDGLRFGEAALILGLIGEDDLRQALARQFAHPCLPDSDTSVDADLIAAFYPPGPEGEALRDLRSILMLRWFGGHRRLLALTSGLPGEGCGRLAANLAVVFSQLGEQTLLIDANLREPELHRWFKLRGDPGLSGVLAGRHSPEKAISGIPALGDLSVLPAGAPPPNPQELLSRASFIRLLDEAAERYDIVLLNTPPALQSADARIVATRAAGCVIVVRRDSTRLGDAAAVKDQLSGAGVEVLGAVLAS